MLEDGESRDSIMRTLVCDSRFIARWSGRFLRERLAGMYARHPGRAPKPPPARLEARVLNRTLKHKPADGSTHWSSYKLAAELGDVSVSTVRRICDHGIKPQRSWSGTWSPTTRTWGIGFYKKYVYPFGPAIRYGCRMTCERLSIPDPQAGAHGACTCERQEPTQQAEQWL
jgi:hypothetical protein